MLLYLNFKKIHLPRQHPVKTFSNASKLGHLIFSFITELYYNSIRAKTKEYSRIFSLFLKNTGI
jgi:hypothetical protein